MIEDRIEVNIAGGLDIALPPMAALRQKFTTTRIDDIAAAVAREFERPGIRSSIRSRARIAVGCASLRQSRAAAPHRRWWKTSKSFRR
jgi:hypothetical protein